MQTSPSRFRTIALIALTLFTTTYTNAAIPDNYYLISSGNGAIHRYSVEGQYIDDLVPANANQLGNPQHMVVRNNKLYVTGYANNALSRIDLATGTIEQQWQLADARGTAFLRESTDGSEFWIGAINSNRILRVDPDTGNILGDLVTPNSIPGPHGILEHTDGSLLIAANNSTIYRLQDEIVTPFITTTGNRPTNMLHLSDGSLLVTAFVNNPSRALRRYDPITGEDLGQFSDTQGRQADGLIRAHNGEILSVFWGSNSIARYNEAGEYLGDFANADSGLSRPNHIIYVPTPSTTALLIPATPLTTRRRRD